MSRIVILVWRMSHWLHRLRVPWVPRLVTLAIRVCFSCQIGAGAMIGSRVKLGYGGLGVIIHGGACVGNRVSIGPGVVIGGNLGKGGVPTVEDDCIIAAGAKILGPVVVGRGAIVGANAVVVSDVAPEMVVVGVPARPLRARRAEEKL